MNALKPGRWQLIVPLLVAASAALVAAEESKQYEFLTLDSGDASLVRIHSLEKFSSDAARTYVVCHGMGGTSAEDRFEKLCRAIKAHQPAANVLLIDWSAASQHKVLGLPNPWRVAKEIKPVASQAAAILRDLKLDPAKTTAIGESFGVYVIAEVATLLGEMEHILACNPANEHGGYAPADLRKSAKRAWSFHTYSPFDTTHEIAHSDFFLQTPVDFDHTAQHTHGIAWLTERIAADPCWLRLEKTLPPSKANAFRCAVQLDGELLDMAISRTRPQPVESEPIAIAP